MFIVLPDSVLGNSTLAAQREHIERLATIVGVVSLSADTFGPSGAKSKTIVLILEKRHEPLAERPLDEDYEVFVAHVPFVGYDFTGRWIERNDLPQMVADFQAFVDDKRTVSAISNVIQRSQLGTYWIAQPHVNSSESETDDDSWLLGDLCSFIQTGKTPARKLYKPIGVHVVKVGNLTGRGIDWGSVERQYADPTFAKRFPAAELKKGDILFTAAAHGPKWIGLKVDIYEGAPEAVGQPVLTCGEVMICRLREDAEVDPYYLLLFLRSEAGYQAIQKCIRGQSGHVYPNEVKTIKIPKRESFDGKRLDFAVTELKEALELRRRAAELEFSYQALAANLFNCGVSKPVIAT